MKTARNTFVSLGLLFAFSACDQSRKPSPAPTPASSSSTAVATSPYAAVDRATFNRVAVQLNLPVYWVEDKNRNKAIDPTETVALLFYPTQDHWVENGKFTPAFVKAHGRIRKAATSSALPKKLPAEERRRRELVRQDLDQGRPTLVYSDLRKAPQEDKSLVRGMLAVAKTIDALFARQHGLDKLHSKLPPDDAASQSLFRRNWGPKCVGPKTEKDPGCSAIPGAPQPIFDSYPGALQEDAAFCKALEKRPDSKKLLSPFSVVREKDGKLIPMEVTAAYHDMMGAVSAKLREAAATQPSKEGALKAYLEAAAKSFTDNDWRPADEAWAKMNAKNSKWYLRVGPDEVYWDPCNQKAGFHLTFAKINTESLRWQDKLTPVQQEMEESLATLIGAPYKARKVAFHLPDFVDIVINAGDDRNPMGATIGQSLPNWGPVANEGRGRTVAMSNLYTDPDSVHFRQLRAQSLLVKPSLKHYVGGGQPSLLSTILHEATHNFGPSHEYKVKGKTDDQVFGGPLATTMEELKAQTGALWYIELLRKKGIITPEMAKQTYADSILWAFNHIARGMYTSTNKPKPYSQLAAIQIGFFLEQKVIRFDPAAQAANGTDKGAFEIHFDKLPETIEALMKLVGVAKATGEKSTAEELVKKYVDGDIVPQKLVAERMLRFPKESFVYAIDL